MIHLFVIISVLSILLSSKEGREILVNWVSAIILIYAAVMMLSWMIMNKLV